MRRTMIYIILNVLNYCNVFNDDVKTEEKVENEVHGVIKKYVIGEREGYVNLTYNAIVRKSTNLTCDNFNHFILLFHNETFFGAKIRMAVEAFTKPKPSHF